VRVTAVGASHGRGEGIEIHHEQIDWFDAVLCHDSFVHATSTEQSAVDLWMQRFHAAVHDLGKAGVARHFPCRDAAARQELCRPTSGEDLDVAFCQRSREVDEAGFIGYGEK